MTPSEKFQLPGLVRAAEKFHQQINIEAARAILDETRLLAGLSSTCQQIESALAAAGIQPGNLPTPSRRAALWFFYLRSAQHLRQHLEITQLYQSTLIQTYHLRHTPPLVKLYYSNYLYRVERRKHSFDFTIHQGYLTAPEAIQKVLLSLPGRKRMSKKTLAALRDYSRSDSFRQIQNELDRRGKAVYRETDAIGKHVHLNEAFQRINYAYFEGAHSLPHLCWSSRPTHRKFGHYNPATDSIQLSRTLDNPQVPEYVIDFVMYHELLHRDLGIHYKNGRHYAHRADFRHQEQDFAHYEQAQAFLKQLASTSK